MALGQDVKGRFEVGRLSRPAADGRVWLSCANARCGHRLLRGGVDQAVTLNDIGAGSLEILCRGCRSLNYIGRGSQP